MSYYQFNTHIISSPEGDFDSPSHFQEGKIHLYECSQRFKCLRLTAVLAHHSGAIHSVAFASESGHIVSCSDDMTIGVVRYANMNWI